MNQTYRVGMYCRLSVDDASNPTKSGNYIPAEDSVSIENQKELLSRFVMLNGWVETRTYIDDGYSGGNFQRPGFVEMLEDARNGVINLILVKDLSRLGRDYVEVGRYADIVFPSLGCRFVSVLDCLDSEGDNTDMLHFRSLMNDYHLRDLSSKIKSVLLAKKQSGQCLSFKAPYGYSKSSEDKHRLVIDEYSANVVRRIFELRASGVSTSKIAAVLNNDSILPPLAYWYQQSGKERRRGSLTWSSVVVTGILRNEVYLGNLIMNYIGSRSYKDSAMVKKPPAEWIRCEGTHEAIIAQEVWNTVQEVNAAATRRYAGRRAPSHQLFSGKLVCADCGGALVANTERHRLSNGSTKEYISYHCGRHGTSGGSVCSRHTIFEKSLTQIILAEIRTQTQAVAVDEAAVADRLRRKSAEYDELYFSDIRYEIAKLNRRIQELEGLTAKLYEDKCNGTISESVFTVLMGKNEQERISKSTRMDALCSQIEGIDKKNAAIHSWLEIIKKHLDLQALDRPTIDELIDHIEIGERYIEDSQRRQNVNVFYRFVGSVV